MDKPQTLRAVATAAVATLLLLPCHLASAEDNAELHRLLVDYTKVLQGSAGALDLDLAAKIWSQTEDITLIHPHGRHQGWEEIRQTFYLDTMGRLANRNLTLRDVSIHILSQNTAWGEFSWDFTASFPDGKPIATSGRETQIWKKENGEWKIVHVHYSEPPRRLPEGDS